MQHLRELIVGLRIYGTCGGFLWALFAIPLFAAPLMTAGGSLNPALDWSSVVALEAYALGLNQQPVLVCSCRYLLESAGVPSCQPAAGIGNQR
jgi:hypothetical protein